MGCTAWNHNLVVTFVFRITFSLTQGLWNSGTGSNYIFYLEDHRNTLVGLVQGIQGVFIPIASLPGGYIADRTRRDAVLRILGVSGFIAIALLIAAVVAPKQPILASPPLDLKYGLLCAGYAFWGIMQASNPIVESILADSVPTGSRSAIYTSLFFLGMLSRGIGPLIAALIFVVDGNTWRVSTLGKALVVGMLASVVPVASLFAFNDGRSLGAESEAHGAEAVEGEKATEDRDAEERVAPKLCGLSQAAIPYILSASDLIYGLASGCTIKFFPIFFAKEVGLTPVAVNVLMAAQPLVIGVTATLGQRLSVHIGRIQVLLLLRLVGFLAMGVMGMFTGLWSKSLPIVAIFLLRTGVNNAGYPIQKAVLMDHVPKRHRGKWSAVDSLTAFGWSGSALLGGVLVDHAGFDWCFLITAAMQCLGWSVMLPLLALVPRTEARNEAAGGLEAERPLLDAEEPGSPNEISGEGVTDLPETGQPGDAAAAEGCAPGGLRALPRKLSRKESREDAAAPPETDDEFVRMIGSLKSPRRSLDEYSNQ